MFRGRGARLPRRVRPYLAPALVFLLFVLPLVPSPGGYSDLTFLGIATPEYGKVVYLWALASVLTRYAVMAPLPTDRTGWRRLVPTQRVRAPLGLFVLVAAASVLRSDMGPLIRVAALPWLARGYSNT